MGNMGGPFDRSISMDFTDEEDEKQRRNNFVDSGDLRIWEFLTTKYDHELIFESSDNTEEMVQQDCRPLFNTTSTPLPANKMETKCSAASTHSSQQRTPVHHEQSICVSGKQINASSMEKNPRDTAVQSTAYQLTPPASGSSDLSQQSFSPLEIAAPMSSLEASMWTIPLYPQNIQQSNLFLQHNPTGMKNASAPEIQDISYKMFMPTNMVPPFQQELNANLLLKPLSPYNYYFRDESDNIVRHLMHSDNSLPPPVSDLTQERMQSLLFQHWYTDPVKKRRRHRKTHGRISFETLARVIAERWEHITPAVRMFYQMVARLDKKYYQDQLEVIAQQKDVFTCNGG